MAQKNDRPTETWGLAANGSSGKWHVSVDESLEGVEWSLEIDGLQTYLVFQLRDPRVIPEAVRFLQARPTSNRTEPRRGEADQSLRLGDFGSASVSLLWDDEDFPRCFLVIGLEARSTLRLSLEAADVQMLREALAQVQEGMTEPACD